YQTAFGEIFLRQAYPPASRRRSQTRARSKFVISGPPKGVARTEGFDLRHHHRVSGTNPASRRSRLRRFALALVPMALAAGFVVAGSGVASADTLPLPIPLPIPIQLPPLPVPLPPLPAPELPVP